MRRKGARPCAAPAERASSSRCADLRRASDRESGHGLRAAGDCLDGSSRQESGCSFRVGVAGLRGEGAFAPGGGIEAAYLAELARQQPHAGGDKRIDAAYRRLGAGVASGPWTLRYDHETKGSNGGRYGLQMPLTDFYAYNGWSLHFFNTPRDGLRDAWLTARLALGPVILYAEAHRFRSDHRGLDFGREIDMGVTWRVRDAVIRLQHARHDPGRDGTGTEVRKTWLTLTYEH